MKKIFLLLFLATSTAFGQADKAALSKPATLKERAPDVFKAKFDTTAGIFIIEVHADWSPKVKQSNLRGYVTFAKSSLPNTRTTQIFINFADNSRLNSQAFAPFGKVTTGMEVVDKINGTYGQMPDQDLISSQGNAYLTKNFPRLDYIKKATIEK